MKHVAILLAGGSGRRMGSSVEDKILVKIHGQTVFSYVLQAFYKSAVIDALVIVARDNQQLKRLSKIVKQQDPGIPVFYALGGKERKDSVKSGLNVIPSVTEWILIHDCARPAVSQFAIQSVLKATKRLNCGVSLARNVSDTIRMFDTSPVDAAVHGKLLDRGKLWAMETPQGFPRQLIDLAHSHLQSTVTDDLAAVEAMGNPVALVESSQPNPKITRPSDLIILESLLAPEDMKKQNPPNLRVGLGYDIHQLKEGRDLVLGGVKIPSEVGLVGHSDADVLSHALADAILGACGLPDIGHYFPNTDPAIAGISSLEILRKARKNAKKRGYRLVNVDATLIAERPKISPYIEEMKSVLANTLKLRTKDIGIKATTQEKLGALGAGKGIAAHAVATLSSLSEEED